MIPRVVAITPGDGRDLDPWLTAVAPFVHAVVLREPAAPLVDLVRWVAAVRAGGALAIVHARSANASGSGIHLPDGADIPPSNGLVGMSCHDGPGLDRAFDLGADYALLSPVWAPISKADDRPVLGLSRFVDLAAGRPVLALGGVDEARAAQVLAAGHGVAVMGWLWGSAGPDAAAGRAQRLAALASAQS